MMHVQSAGARRVQVAAEFLNNCKRIANVLVPLGAVNDAGRKPLHPTNFANHYRAFVL